MGIELYSWQGLTEVYFGIILLLWNPGLQKQWLIYQDTICKGSALLVLSLILALYIDVSHICIIKCRGKGIQFVL